VAKASAISLVHTTRRVHPLPVRIMHWINAVAIFIMIGSGWKIYNDDIIFIFSFLRFPDSIVIGKWAQYGLEWHFFGMWIFALNGLAYLSYGIATGRFRRKLFPISHKVLGAGSSCYFSKIGGTSGSKSPHTSCLLPTISGATGWR
jgi:thiosulfate reductase cytochrome b subunit